MSPGRKIGLGRAVGNVAFVQHHPVQMQTTKYKARDEWTRGKLPREYSLTKRSFE